MKCKRFILLFVVVLLAAASIGCSKKLDGYWYAVDGAPYGYPDEIEFLGDNMCVVDGIPCMFQLDNKTFMFSVMGQIMTYQYARAGKDTFTLDDGYEKVTYSSDPNAQPAFADAYAADDPVTDEPIPEAPAAEAPAAEPAPTDTPVPTLSPEELERIAYDEDIAALKAKLSEYDAKNDVEGAIQYLTEQLSQLEITYPNVTPDPELETLLTSHKAAFKTDALQRADAAMTESGYQAALDVLHAAVPYLDPDDEDMQKAIKHYKSFGPTYLADMEYFTREDDGFKLCTEDVKDNLGNEHEKVLGNSDGSGYNGPEFISQTYVLNGRYTTFTGCCYLRFYARSDENLSSQYRFYGDDELLYKSESIPAGTMPIEFTVDVTGVNLLRIELEAVQKGTMFGTVGATGYYQLGEALLEP